MNDRSFPVGILAGITIATIGLELPVLAIPQPAPVLVAQVACVVRKQTAVYTTANPGDPEVLGRILTSGTLVGLAKTLPTNLPARVEINQPTNGFVDYVALDCGRESLSQNPPKTTVCRKVRNTVSPMNVYREPSWQSKPIGQVQVFADQTVYVTQTGGVTTSREGWVEVDLQRTFGKNFGLSPSVGWLSNTDPDNQMSTLVNGCGR